MVINYNYKYLEEAGFKQVLRNSQLSSTSTGNGNITIDEVVKK